MLVTYKSISNGAAIAQPGANFGGPQGVVVLQRSRNRSCQQWRGWTNPAFGHYLRQLCPPEIHPRHQSRVHKLDKCDTLVTLWDICLQPAKARLIHPPTVGDALSWPWATLPASFPLLEFPLVAFAKKRNAIEYLHLCISALLAENPHGLSSCFKKKGKKKTRA
jgi:hypothetical protein